MRYTLLIFLILLVSACSEPETSSEVGTTITAEVLYSTGDHPFGQVTAVELLENGGLAVADAQADHIAIFNERGELVDTIGGAGDGPGELSGLVTVHQLPDGSLATLSHSYTRLTVFGEVLQTYSVGQVYNFPTIGAGPTIYGRVLETSSDSLEWRMKRTPLGNSEVEEASSVVDFQFTPQDQIDVVERDGEMWPNPYQFGNGTKVHFNRNGDYAYLSYPDTATVVANLDTGETHRLPLQDWEPIEQDMAEVRRYFDILGSAYPESLGNQSPVRILNIHVDDQGRV